MKNHKFTLNSTPDYVIDQNRAGACQNNKIKGVTKINMRHTKYCIRYKLPKCSIENHFCTKSIYFDQNREIFYDRMSIFEQFLSFWWPNRAIFYAKDHFWQFFSFWWSKMANFMKNIYFWEIYTFSWSKKANFIENWLWCTFNHLDWGHRRSKMVISRGELGVKWI